MIKLLLFLLLLYVVKLYLDVKIDITKDRQVLLYYTWNYERRFVNLFKV